MLAKHKKWSCTEYTKLYMCSIINMEECVYTIDDFQKINKSENIIISLHGQLRLHERKISVDDVMNAIDNGEIIEQYPEDFPFPSCLILGLAVASMYIHVVVSMNDGKIYLITAYVPSADKWEADWKTRKERSK